MGERGWASPPPLPRTPTRVEVAHQHRLTPLDLAHRVPLHTAQPLHWRRQLEAHTLLLHAARRHARHLLRRALLLEGHDLGGVEVGVGLDGFGIGGY